MTDAYIDSTLHNEWNVQFNPLLCKALEDKKISVYLPQRDTNQENRDTIFEENKTAMDNARVIIAVAKNESPNWGVEVGYAFASKKVVIGLTEKDHYVPLMASHMMKEIVRVNNLDEIEEYIDELAKIIEYYR